MSTTTPADLSDASTSTNAQADDAEPPELEQAVAGATVLATPGDVFESETVATPMSWSSPDIDSGRVLEVSLEEAAVYGSLGDASSVGYAFRIDNSSEVDLDENAVVELHIPGAVELTAESQEDWSCDAVGATWRCQPNGSLLAESSSIIRVAAIVPEPAVITYVDADPSEDLVVFGSALAAMLGLLYAVMHVLTRPRGESAG